MKMLKSFSMWIAAIAILTITSCAKDEVSRPQKETQTPIGLQKMASGLTGDALDAFNNKVAEFDVQGSQQQLGSAVSTRSPISYISELCGDPITHTHPNTGSVGDPALGDYYSFSGNAGDPVMIYVPRVCEGDMDPIAYVLFGTITDSDDFYTLPFINGADDIIASACGGCYWDPYMEFNLPTQEPIQSSFGMHSSIIGFTQRGSQGICVFNERKQSR